MYIIILIILISFCLNESPLLINNIYISNYKFTNSSFFLILNLKENDILNFFVQENIFKINIESENPEESNKIITFICDLFVSSFELNPFIKCYLKEKIPLFLKGPFYFREEFFQKSFTIKNNNKTINLTLKIKKEEFHLGMIRSLRIIKNLFPIFNYRISNFVIPIAMCLNNGYFYPTIVAMTSILENANLNTKYDFYILYSPDLSNENKKYFLNLEKKYYRCSINLIKIINFKFKNALLTRHITTLAAYYRLALSDLIPNEEKIIYLDSDTLTFTDLKEMYDIDMNGFYYKGFLDISLDFFIPYIENYICSGILLINLKKLRDDDVVNKMFEYMLKNNKNLYFHDQTIINGVCNKNIGILPPKFGVFNLKFNVLYSHAKRTFAYKNKTYKYSKEELKFAYNHPSIMHVSDKPWKKGKIYKKNDWIYYAKKTGLFKKMLKSFIMKNTMKTKKKKHKKKKKRKKK